MNDPNKIYKWYGVSLSSASLFTKTIFKRPSWSVAILPASCAEIGASFSEKRVERIRGMAVGRVMAADGFMFSNFVDFGKE